MKNRDVWSSCAAVALSCSVLSAQGVSPRTPAAQAPAAEEQAQITVSGCVMPGTGANEFTLGRATAARPTASAPVTGAPGTSAAGREPSPTGTSGSAAPTAYSLLATPAQKLSQYVGQRVEIVATPVPAPAADANLRGVPGATTGSAGSTEVVAGGPTRGAAGVGTTAQVSGASQPHETAMQRITVVSVRPATGNCQ